MSFSYNPLWKTLIDKGLKKGDLKEGIKASPTTIARMGKNEYVSMQILDDICNFLNCRIESIIEHVPDPKEAE